MKVHSNNGTCGGKLRNGPGKRYARCVRCGQIDWEGNEGDACIAPKEGKP